MTRNGKIARLPRPLRDELNRRLSANEDGAPLLDWLNAASDAKAVLARDFAGEPVSKQNFHSGQRAGPRPAQGPGRVKAGKTKNEPLGPPTH